MSQADTLEEQSQWQFGQFLYGGDSDMSDSSYQSYQMSEGYPCTRQSSINTEPLTLGSDEIGTAKDEAEHVLENVPPEDAMDIFTKDLKVVEKWKIIAEGEMENKLVRRSERARPAINHGGGISEEDLAKKLARHLKKLEKKTSEIVEASDKLASSTSKSPAAPREQQVSQELGRQKDSRKHTVDE